MYVAVTGTMASGKGEIVRMLKKKGFVHYSFGDMLRAQQLKAGLDTSISTTTSYANKLRKEHGAAYLAEMCFKKMQEELPKHAVFEALVNLAELATLKRLPGLILVSVDAPQEIRYERVQDRARRDNIKSFAEFAEWEEKQMEGAPDEQQRLLVMDEADIKVVNIGNLEELAEQVREALDL